MRKNLGKRRRARKLRQEKVERANRKYKKWRRSIDLYRGYSIGLFGKRIYLS